MVTGEQCACIINIYWMKLVVMERGLSWPKFVSGIINAPGFLSQTSFFFFRVVKRHFATPLLMGVNDDAVEQTAIKVSLKCPLLNEESRFLPEDTIVDIFRYGMMKLYG